MKFFRLVMILTCASMLTPVFAIGQIAKNSCEVTFSEFKVNLAPTIDVWDVASVTGLELIEVQKLELFAKGIQTIAESLSRGIPRGAYLLGPQGDNYTLLLKVFKLQDFWSAFEAVRMHALVAQTRVYVHEFLTKLANQESHPVYFLIPENYQLTVRTSLELKILLSDPDLMHNITFIYGPEEFAGSIKASDRD